MTSPFPYSHSNITHKSFCSTISQRQEVMVNCVMVTWTWFSKTCHDLLQCGTFWPFLTFKKSGCCSLSIDHYYTTSMLAPYSCKLLLKWAYCMMISTINDHNFLCKLGFFTLLHRFVSLLGSFECGYLSFIPLLL